MLEVFSDEWGRWRFSVMSGDVGGVQRKMQDLVPHAVYVHCLAHRVNLVSVNVCKNEPIARDFF